MSILRSFFRGGSFLKQFFPLLKHFPEMSGLNTRKRANAKLRSMFVPVIEEHKRQAEEGVVKDDFIGRCVKGVGSFSMYNSRDMLL